MMAIRPRCLIARSYANLALVAVLVSAGPAVKAGDRQVDVTLTCSSKAVWEGGRITFTAGRAGGEPGDLIIECRVLGSAGPWQPIPPLPGAPGQAVFVGPEVPGPTRFAVRARAAGSGESSRPLVITVLPVIAGMERLVASRDMRGMVWEAFLGSPPALSPFAQVQGPVACAGYWDGQGGPDVDAWPRCWLVGTADGRVLEVDASGKAKELPGTEDLARLAPAGARRHIDAIAVQPYQAGNGQARAIVIAERLDGERMVGSPEPGHGLETKGSLRTVASTRLWRLEPGRPIRLLAGQGLESKYPEGDPLSTDGAGKGARFRDPIQAMAMNAEGVVFLIEGLPLQIHQNAIRKVAPNGTVTTLGSGHGYRGFRDGPLSRALFSHPQGLAVDGNVVYFTDRNHVRMLTAEGQVLSLVRGTVPEPRPLSAAAKPLGQVLAPGTLLDRTMGLQKLGRYLFIETLESEKGISSYRPDILVLDLDTHFMWTLFGNPGIQAGFGFHPGLLKPFAPAGTRPEACAALGRSRKSMDYDAFPGTFHVNAEGAALLAQDGQLLSLDLGPYGEDAEATDLHPDPAGTNLWPTDLKAGDVRSADGISHPRYVLDPPTDTAPASMRHEVPCRFGQVLAGRAWVSAAGLRDGAAGIGIRFLAGDGTEVPGQGVAPGPGRFRARSAGSQGGVEVLGAVPEGAARAVLTLSAAGHPGPGGGSAVFKDVDFRFLPDPPQPNLWPYGSSTTLDPPADRSIPVKAKVLTDVAAGEGITGECLVRTSGFTTGRAELCIEFLAADGRTVLDQGQAQGPELPGGTCGPGPVRLGVQGRVPDGAAQARLSVRILGEAAAGARATFEQVTFHRLPPSTPLRPNLWRHGGGVTLTDPGLGGEAVRVQAVDCRAGERFAAACYVFHDPTAASRPELGIQFDTGDGSAVLRRAQPVPGGHATAGWTALAVEDEVPHGATRALMLIRVQGNPVPGARTRFEGVTFSRVP